MSTPGMGWPDSDYLQERSTSTGNAEGFVLVNGFALLRFLGLDALLATSEAALAAWWQVALDEGDRSSAAAPGYGDLIVAPLMGVWASDAEALGSRFSEQLRLLGVLPVLSADVNGTLRELEEASADPEHPAIRALRGVELPGGGLPGDLLDPDLVVEGQVEAGRFPHLRLPDGALGRLPLPLRESFDRFCGRRAPAVRDA